VIYFKGSLISVHLLVIWIAVGLGIFCF